MKIYLMNGSCAERNPIRFEFRVNNISNWIEIVNEDGSVEEFHNIGAISYTKQTAREE